MISFEPSNVRRDGHSFFIVYFGLGRESVTRKGGPRRSIILIKSLSQSIDLSMIDRVGTCLTLEARLDGD